MASVDNKHFILNGTLAGQSDAFFKLSVPEESQGRFYQVDTVGRY